jgi:hypothetical protein
MKDEGIVQAVSKGMEQLSRRLHQKCRFPGEILGACLPFARYDVPWSAHGTPNNFQQMSLPTLRDSSTANQIGVGKITRKKTTSDRHTPSFCYSISSRQALSLLRQIAPHLRSYKRQRAELLLERYVALTPRNGKYTANQLAYRREFESDFLNVTAHG